MQKHPGSKTLIKDPSSEIIILREREREREREKWDMQPMQSIILFNAWSIKPSKKQNKCNS